MKAIYHLLPVFFVLFAILVLTPFATIAGNHETRIHSVNDTYTRIDNNRERIDHFEMIRTIDNNFINASVAVEEQDLYLQQQQNIDRTVYRYYTPEGFFLELHSNYTNGDYHLNKRGVYNATVHTDTQIINRQTLTSTSTTTSNYTAQVRYEFIGYEDYLLDNETISVIHVTETHNQINYVGYVNTTYSSYNLYINYTDGVQTFSYDNGTELVEVIEDRNITAHHLYAPGVGTIVESYINDTVNQLSSNTIYTRQVIKADVVNKFDWQPGDPIQLPQNDNHNDNHNDNNTNNITNVINFTYFTVFFSSLLLIGILNKKFTLYKIFK